MSDNPFDAPVRDDNPFSNPQETEADNPFSNPPVQAEEVKPQVDPTPEATPGTYTPPTADTFRNNDQANTLGTPMTSPVAATEESETVTLPPLPKGASPELKKAYAMMQKKNKDFERKADILKKREVEVKRREDALGPANNWPACYPIVYHSIKNDISSLGQSICRRQYFNWWLTFITYCANAAAATAFLMSGEGNNGAQDFGIALAWLVLYPGLAFFLWYFRFYNAVKNNQPSGYGFFWIFFTLHFIIIAISCIGIQGLGAIGFIHMKILLDENKQVEAFFAIASFACFFFCFIWTIVMYVQSYKHQQQMGITLEQARKEIMMKQAKKAVIG
eukprot:TRINITY_DN22641_c0_g1_i1.p1 TRINITY_DN22641_c0_g1~~TRINITY_DN22641_c0_g1_i1.p1  ORF type:complete len:333 (-),score=82.86 TRINITY_DN22641_c0_g1_i1:35-1033(-)